MAYRWIFSWNMCFILIQKICENMQTLSRHISTYASLEMQYWQRTGKSLPVQLPHVTVQQYVIANLKPCRRCSAEQQLALPVELCANERPLQKPAFYTFLILEVVQEEVDPAYNSACGKLDKSKLNGTVLRTNRTQCLVQQVQLLQFHSLDLILLQWSSHPSSENNTKTINIWFKTITYAMKAYTQLHNRIAVLL